MVLFWKKNWVDIAGTIMESFWQKYPPYMQGERKTYKWGYCPDKNQSSPPNQDTLKKVIADKTALYWKEDPPGESISIMVEPEDVLDEILEMEKIIGSVKKLCENS